MGTRLMFMYHLLKPCLNLLFNFTIPNVFCTLQGNGEWVYMHTPISHLAASMNNSTSDNEHCSSPTTSYTWRGHDVTSMFSTYTTIHTLPHTRALSVFLHNGGFKLWTLCSSDWAPPIRLQNMDTGLSKGMANKFTTEKESVCETSPHSSMQMNYSQPPNPVPLGEKGRPRIYVCDTTHTVTYLTDWLLQLISLLATQICCYSYQLATLLLDSYEVRTLHVSFLSPSTLSKHLEQISC